MTACQSPRGKCWQRQRYVNNVPVVESETTEKFRHTPQECVNEQTLTIERKAERQSTSNAHGARVRTSSIWHLLRLALGLTPGAGAAVTAIKILAAGWSNGTT